MDGAFDIGSVVAKVKADLSGFTQGMDQAKSQAESLGESFGNTVDKIRGFAEQAAVVVGVQTVAFGELAKQAIDVASNFEQTQASFGTLLGSEEKAAALMKEIMLFEMHTPFDIQTLTNAAKNLLAYDVAQQEIVPHLKEFTDMSQGQVYKLNELVSIYGQVNSIQSLNGREVLRLSSIGIPIYQAIADHYNKMGASATEAGGKISAMTNQTVENSKMSASARQAASDRLAEETTRLGILEQEHGKTKLATEKHDLAVQTLKDHIAETTEKLGSHTKAVGGLGVAAKVTAENVRDMISQHQITSQVFDQVLTEMTSKGGLFFNENIRQMNTYAGIMSSVQSQTQYALLNILGIDLGAANEVRKGGLFDTLRNLAGNLLEWLQKLQPVFKEIGENKTFQLAIEGFVIALASLAVILPVIILILNPVALIIFAIEAAIVALYIAWNENFMGIRNITNQIINFVKGLLAGLLDYIKFNQNNIMLDIRTAWDLIKNIVQIGLLAIKEFWERNGAVILIIVSGLWNAIKGIFEIVVAILDTITTIFLASLTGNWKGAGDKIYNDSNVFFHGLAELFIGFVKILLGIGDEILQAIMSPFQNAYKQINDIMAKIKDAIDFTKRHSPSVLDIVQNGVSLVNDALAGVKFSPNVSTSQIASNYITPLSEINNPANSGFNLTIQLPNAIISDPAGANRMAEQLGNLIIGRLKQNIRF